MIILFGLWTSVCQVFSPKAIHHLVVALIPFVQMAAKAKEIYEGAQSFTSNLSVFQRRCLTTSPRRSNPPGIHSLPHLTFDPKTLFLFSCSVVCTFDCSKLTLLKLYTAQSTCLALASSVTIWTQRWRNDLTISVWPYGTAYIVEIIQQLPNNSRRNLWCKYNLSSSTYAKHPFYPHSKILSAISLVAIRMWSCNESDCLLKFYNDKWLADEAIRLSNSRPKLFLIIWPNNLINVRKGSIIPTKGSRSFLDEFVQMRNNISQYRVFNPCLVKSAFKLGTVFWLWSRRYLRGCADQLQLLANGFMRDFWVVPRPC